MIIDATSKWPASLLDPGLKSDEPVAKILKHKAAVSKPLLIWMQAQENGSIHHVPTMPNVLSANAVQPPKESKKKAIDKSVVVVKKIHRELGNLISELTTLESNLALKGKSATTAIDAELEKITKQKNEHVITKIKVLLALRMVAIKKIIDSPDKQTISNMEVNNQVLIPLFMDITQSFSTCRHQQFHKYDPLKEKYKKIPEVLNEIDKLADSFSNTMNKTIRQFTATLLACNQAIETLKI